MSNHHHHHEQDGEHHHEEEEEIETFSTLNELVPGAAIHNLIFRVGSVKTTVGEAVIETAHGTCTLMYDLEKVGDLIKIGNTCRVLHGFGWTEETGRLVIRLEDPEEESIIIEQGEVDLDDVTPPPENAQQDISSINRVFGLLVIREDKCLLCPAGLTKGKFSFPVHEADGDEPERTAAIRAFQSITEIDVNEIYILNQVPPCMGYEEEFVCTIYVAYSRRPFNRRNIPSSQNNDAYSWFTYDQAIDSLETDGSKSCLERIYQSLNAAIQNKVVKTCFGARFGPTIINTNKQQQNDNNNIQALVARTSALFYLKENGLISSQEFDKLLSLKTQNNIKEEEEENKTRQKKQIPVTVLSGFLGAGKTTLVNHILSNNEQKEKIAIIVNDMAEVNVDASLIKNKNEKQDNLIVEMTNGCICCTLREDLLLSVKKLALENKYDYILIESTGIGEPLSIAETFTFGVGEEDEDEEKKMILNDLAKLDTLVTVVDSSSVIKDFESSELSSLLTQQIEFANVIILNKLDLIQPPLLLKVRALISTLNPKAKVIECSQGQVELNQVLNTNLFSFQEAQLSPGWLQTLRGEKVSETLEYGIGSVIFKSEFPLDGTKLKLILEQTPFSDFIIRSKGIIWVKGKLGYFHAIEWSGAGHSYQFYKGKSWMEKNDQNVPIGKCEVVLIGFFENETISKNALELLNTCVCEKPTINTLDWNDDNADSIKISLN